MAIHKSAIKRNRQSEKKRVHNRSYKSELKTTIKKLRSMENRETAQAEYPNVVSLLDKLVAKKIIHKNNAANKKSKLAHFIAKLG